MKKVKILSNWIWYGEQQFSKEVMADTKWLDEIGVKYKILENELPNEEPIINKKKKNDSKV